MLYLLQSRLTEKGFNCLIKNEAPCGQAAGEIPPVAVMPELWLMDDDDYTNAMQIVQHELSHLSSPKTDWICSQCGEHLEGQFDICWKCGLSKSDSA